MDPLAELARRAYAAGWAASGGPMTDRVRAGAVAAVELALAHADRPDVLEATLRLGHLEGTWAEVYRRREELTARVGGPIRAAWKALAGKVDVDRLVRAARRRAGMVLEASGVNDAPTRAELGVIIRAALERLETDAPDEWTALRQAFYEAVVSGRAEGRAMALAVAADQQGYLGLSFELVFEEAYQRMKDSAVLSAEADWWIRDLFGDVAADVGRVLERLTRDGAAWDEMRAEVAALLDDPDMRAVEVAIQQVTGRALSQGQIDLWSSEGVQQVDYVTAGGNRVCPVCEAAEDRNPYPLGASPVPPLHPYCRCALVAVNPIPVDRFARYLPQPQEA